MMPRKKPDGTVVNCTGEVIGRHDLPETALWPAAPTLVGWLQAWNATREETGMERLLPPASSSTVQRFMETFMKKVTHGKE